MRHLLSSLIVLAGATAPTASAVGGGEAWIPDLGPALRLAADEGKDLLVDFTGSDWCGWCKRLDREVFQHDEFLDYASEHFVLVALDFPREGGQVWKAMPADLHQANRAESEAFDIEGYPTIVLMTADGVAYARTGYKEGGPEAYVEHLEQLRGAPARAQRQAATAMLATLGDDRASDELDAAYALLGSVVAARREALIDVIARLDSDDSRQVLARADLQGFLATHLSKKRPDFDAAGTALERLRSERASLERLASFHYYRGMIAAQRGDGALAAASLDAVDRIGGLTSQARDALAAAVAGLEGDD